jgi:hypothetical protein
MQLILSMVAQMVPEATEALARCVKHCLAE